MDLYSLHRMSSWRSADLFKHRDNFSFTFTDWCLQLAFYFEDFQLEFDIILRDAPSYILLIVFYTFLEFGHLTFERILRQFCSTRNCMLYISSVARFMLFLTEHSAP
jgi:hypothetical protein